MKHTADRIVKMNEKNILKRMEKHNKQQEYGSSKFMGLGWNIGTGTS